MITVRHRLASRLLLLPAAALVAMPLAACGSESSDTDAASEAAITVTDAWVRASEGPMTGSFGIISNASDAEVTVVAATTTASEMTELHEVVMIDGEMKMQDKPDGYVVPAVWENVVSTGDDHLMVINMDEQVLDGDVVVITLVLVDGTSFS